MVGEKKKSRHKGSGSIYQLADGRWVAQVEAGVTATGRRRYMRRFTTSESKADLELGKLEREVRRNLEPGVARQI